MAIIKCTECGKEVSDQASKCPHCGKRNPGNKDSFTPVLAFVSGAIIGAWAGASLVNTIITFAFSGTGSSTDLTGLLVLAAMIGAIIGAVAFSRAIKPKY